MKYVVTYVARFAVEVEAESLDEAKDAADAVVQSDDGPPVANWEFQSTEASC